MPDLEQQPHQENLSLGITEAEWAAVEELLRQLEEDRAREATVEQIGFWLSAVRLVRGIEDRVGDLGKLQLRDLEYHRFILEMLMGMGGHLAFALRKIEEQHLRAVGLNPANFDAIVEELRMKHAARYGGMTDGRRAEILKDVFGVEAPTA
jgi:hypothetical protein